MLLCRTALKQVLHNLLENPWRLPWSTPRKNPVENPHMEDPMADPQENTSLWRTSKEDPMEDTLIPWRTTPLPVDAPHGEPPGRTPWRPTPTQWRTLWDWALLSCSLTPLPDFLPSVFPSSCPDWGFLKSIPNGLFTLMFWSQACFW